MQEGLLYDMIGVGFGPSNLALAAAVAEESRGRELNVLFLDQKPEFSWHSDMLLPGAEMQISFLKDLVTLRNPRSRFTFLNYLKESGRLSAFSNLRHFYPTRVEFNDYLRWVAAQLSHCVQYGRNVESVVATGHAPHAAFEITARDVRGQSFRYMARNLVVAPGGSPALPFPVRATQDKVWHSSTYLRNIKRFAERQPSPRQLVVVGRGQSAAEIALDLYRRFPRATICCVYRGFSMKPADDSEFVNQVFDHAFIDFVYNADHDLRSSIVREHQDTNYSVVDAELIRELYMLWYQEKVTGQSRLRFHNFLRVQDIADDAEAVRLHCRSLSDDRDMVLQADAVVLATGYNYPNPPAILDGVRHFLRRDENQAYPRVSRHYRVDTDTRLEAGIYLQGCNEHTHGLSDTLLSVLAIRADEILSDVLDRQGLALEKMSA